MKITNKICLSVSVALSVLAMTSASADYGNNGSTRQVSITNISSTVLTPPIVALCKKRMAPIARVGKAASDQLEAVAEGGDTTGLASLFAENDCNVVAADGPVLPGQTIILEVEGKRNDRLHMASMLLPTNDGFVFSSGKRVKNIIHRGGISLKSYDAGTEFNDELCAHIPGPPCGGAGEGFNAEREANNFVRPHPGLSNVGDVNTAQFAWGEPVARIHIK